MAASTRIPPAVNESFVQLASDVCDRAKMDYDEWLVNSQELVFHLQERWREGVEMGLNTDDAQSRALELFGDPSVVAKSLRKPWLIRLLYFHRFRSERFYFFVLAYFLYTWIVIFDTHWKDLLQKNNTTPFQILLPFGLDFFRDGFGAMFVGFAAAGCVVLAQWQPIFKMRWVNQLLLIRLPLLLLTGYALFALAVRSPYLAFITLPDIINQFPAYTRITVPFCIMHIIAIVLGWFGSICLLYEIWGRGWHMFRMHVTLAGFAVAIYLTFGLTSTTVITRDEPPPLTSTNIKFILNGETSAGKQVSAWLYKTKWFEYHQGQKFIGENRKDDELTRSFQFDNWQETYDRVYLYDHESKAWKFNDMHLHSLRGLTFDLDLSLIIREPGKAQGVLMIRNGTLTDPQKKLVAVFFKSGQFTQKLN